MARDPNKGLSMRQLRKQGLCRTCSCNPCGCTREDQKQQTRADNIDSYNTRKAEEQFQREHGSKPTPVKKKAKAKPKKSKAAFVRDLKKRNPTMSDSAIKKACKKAGYPIGCLSVIVFLALSASGVGWGIYEGVHAIIG